jgi:DNA-binding response OmpR family regulator
MADCGAFLVADDDSRFRTYVRELLERVGYTVLEADTTEQTLEFARERLPQVVLVDIHLPEVGGYEVFQTLRDEFGERLAIAFLTETRTESFDRSGGLLLGADDYIVKPFEPDEFLARMRTLLRHARRYRRSTSPAGSWRYSGCLRRASSRAEIARRLSISPRTPVASRRGCACRRERPPATGCGRRAWKGCARSVPDACARQARACWRPLHAREEGAAEVAPRPVQTPKRCEYADGDTTRKGAFHLLGRRHLHLRLRATIFRRAGEPPPPQGRSGGVNG